MQEEDPLRKIIDGAFENQVVSHYMMVAEVVTEKGQQLRLVSSEGMTPWLAIGLLRAAEEMVMAYDEVFDEDDEP